MRNLVIAAALATAIVSTVAPAPLAAQEFQASRVIESFDIGTLRAVVTELGGTVREHSDGDGYFVRFSNGRGTKVSFTACRASGCLGTHLEASFAKPRGKSEVAAQNIAVEFNQSERALKTYHLGDGRTMAEHYIIADGGITMENYRRQFSLFAYMLDQYAKEIYGD